MEKDIFKRATGKEIEYSKTGDGFKLGNYMLTAGDARRIEAGFRSNGVCARVRPGRFSTVWVKPEDRCKLN